MANEYPYEPAYLYATQDAQVTTDTCTCAVSYPCKPCSNAKQIAQRIDHELSELGNTLRKMQ